MRGKTLQQEQSIDGPGHSIAIGNGLIDRAGEYVRRWAPAHRYAIITDSNVGELYGKRVITSLREAGLACDLLTFPAGEASKTRETWGTLSDELLSTGFGRDSVIVALGGGVVGDLAGFLAGTFMRGIPAIHIPTSLVAMVDSAIGGKTGLDAPAGKNLLGVFHLPAGVVVDPQVLATLPLRELGTGFAEVLKHGVIADDGYFADVAAGLPALLSVSSVAGDQLRAAIVRSIEIKSEIVRADVRESDRRKVLNFGHTLGHAIEAASGYTLLHGEAVAIGMVAEAAAGEVAGISERGTADRIRDALVRANLPVGVPSSVGTDRVLEIARTDKKSREGSLRFAVPRRIGEMAGADSGWVVAIPDETIREVLR